MSLAAAAALSVVMAGVVSLLWTDSEENQTWNSFLSTFNSDEQLRDFFSDPDNYPTSGNEFSDGMRYEMGMSDDQAGSSQNSFSKTNVQVEGVDEMDIVKTDGTYIYRSTGDGVSIIKAFPPSELTNVSVIDKERFTNEDSTQSSFWVGGLFVSSGKLVVVASISEYYYYLWDYMMAPGGVTPIEDYHPPRTVVGVFDLSDPSEPDMELTLGISGYPTAARMIDDKVYVVSNSYSWSYYSEDVEIPEIWIDDEASDMSPSKIHYDPEVQDAYSFVNLLALDVSSGDFDYESIVSGYTSTVYMTTESLYLTFEKWVGDWNWAENDLATSEPDGPWTTIYKVDIDGLTMMPQAKGDVEGWLLNQFSMDESGGHLRVATTTSWIQPKNSVWVLGPDLSTIGTLQDIAPTETIYSARFLGDTLYLVTFRQIDPLFIIDLSNPAAPKILGELEIPGFSSYLHPLDENHLVGIGQELGRLKVSVFDVSDPTNPIEYSKFVDDSDYSYSEALYDHKAVLIDVEKGLLVIPGTRNNYGDECNWSHPHENGAFVFSISVDQGVSLKGFVEHAPVSDHWYGVVDRALYIGDYLYTISDSVIQANNLSDLSYVTSLIYDTEDWWYYYPADVRVDSVD